MEKRITKMFNTCFFKIQPLLSAECSNIEGFSAANIGWLLYRSFCQWQSQANFCGEPIIGIGRCWWVVVEFRHPLSHLCRSSKNITSKWVPFPGLLSFSITVEATSFLRFVSFLCSSFLCCLAVQAYKSLYENKKISWFLPRGIGNIKSLKWVKYQNNVGKVGTDGIKVSKKGNDQRDGLLGDKGHFYVESAQLKLCWVHNQLKFSSI